MGDGTFKLAQVALGKLAYQETGAGQPLLMLHGGEGNKGQYSIFVPHLAGGIRAISYDQRDIADSFSSPGPYTMTDLADDCVQFMDALSIEKAHLLGISFGGALALNVAVHHQDRVQTLIAGAAPVTASDGNKFRNSLLTLPPADRGDALLKAAITDEGQRDPDLMTLVRSIISGSYLQPGSHRTAAMAAHNVSGQLGSVTAPTLLVFGSDDPLVPQEHGHQLAAGIANSELVVIEGARHGLASEFRKQMADLASGFVLAHPVPGA